MEDNEGEWRSGNCLNSIRSGIMTEAVVAQMLKVVVPYRRQHIHCEGMLYLHQLHILLLTLCMPSRKQCHRHSVILCYRKFTFLPHATQDTQP